MESRCGWGGRKVLGCQKVLHSLGKEFVFYPKGCGKNKNFILQCGRWIGRDKAFGQRNQLRGCYSNLRCRDMEEGILSEVASCFFFYKRTGDNYLRLRGL